MKNLKQYYKELGKMVYAVAIADGVITPEEKETLHHFVIKNLVKYEHQTDSSGMNEAFYVDFEFDEGAYKYPDSDTAVRSFGKFVQSNFEMGDEDLLRHSMELLEKVAAAYSREKERGIVDGIKNEIAEIYKES